MVKKTESKFNTLFNLITAFGAAIGVLIVCIFGCPIYEIFGVCCPCCGVTRAWLCFLRGNVAEAFRYHALFPLLPLLGILYILNDRIPRRWKPMANSVLIAVAVAAAIYSILRWCGFVAMPVGGCI